METNTKQVEKESLAAVVDRMARARAARTQKPKGRMTDAEMQDVRVKVEEGVIQRWPQSRIAQYAGCGTQLVRRLEQEVLNAWAAADANFTDQQRAKHIRTLEYCLRKLMQELESSPSCIHVVREIRETVAELGMFDGSRKVAENKTILNDNRTVSITVVSTIPRPTEPEPVKEAPSLLPSCWFPSVLYCL